MMMMKAAWNFINLSDACPLHVILLISCLVQALSVVGSGEIKKINGVLVDVQDDCHPGKKDSCKPGFCCVKEVIAYRPQYKGQKAAYKLACKRMRREGEFCMPEDVLHICPCNKGFECHAEKGMDYGHCRRMKKSINKSTKMGIGI